MSDPEFLKSARQTIAMQSAQIDQHFEQLRQKGYPGLEFVFDLATSDAAPDAGDVLAAAREKFGDGFGRRRRTPAVPRSGIRLVRRESTSWRWYLH